MYLDKDGILTTAGIIAVGAAFAILFLGINIVTDGIIWLANWLVSFVISGEEPVRTWVYKTFLVMLFLWGISIVVVYMWREMTRGGRTTKG